MKKVDFSKVMLEDIQGNPLPGDFHEILGNQLYMQGKDIKECELGRKVYLAAIKDDAGRVVSAEVELADDEVNMVRETVKGWSYVARTAIEKMLDT
jgi:hypothetical protein